MPGNDSYVKSLLHFNSDLTDVGVGGSQTWTAHGGASIDTSVKKFGAGSLAVPTNQYIDAPSTPDFAPAGDFTVDAWVNYNGGTSYPIILGSDTSGGLQWGIDGNGLFLAHEGIVQTVHSTGGMSTGVWHHCALVRSGTTIYLFLDGTQTGTGTDAFVFVVGGPMIGIDKSFTYWLHGNVDEFRMSNGIARWTANFTPPTGEYTGGAFELNCAPGSYSITGSPLTPLADRMINAGPGSYAISGADLTPLADRMINAGPGSYVITGADVGVVADRVLSLDPGSYVISGANLTPLAARVLNAAPGVYNLTGFDAGLAWSGAPTAGGHYIPLPRRLIRKINRVPFFKY